jgi:hypothetical protein
MRNFQSEISFSEHLAEKRIHKAQVLFGEKTINFILAIALFLLGGNRKDISAFLGWPIGTLFSLLTRFNDTGVKAFIDQRMSQIQETAKTVQIKPELQPPQNYLTIIWGEREQRILIAPEKNKLALNASNPLQLKTIILTFLNSGLLTANQASEILGLTERRVYQLNQMLQQEDVSSFIDKRQGQQQAYKFTEEIKAGLIQQYTANIITGRSTASTQITKQLNEAYDCTVSDRWVRHYITTLGLNRIKKTLPKVIHQLKKNSKIL